VAINLEPIVLRRVAVKAQIKALQAELKVHDAHLLEHLGVGTETIAGHDVIIMETPGDWSAAGKREFIAQHPEADYPELYQTTVTLNTEAAALVLTQAELDAYLLDVKKYVKDIK